VAAVWAEIVKAIPGDRVSLPDLYRAARAAVDRRPDLAAPLAPFAAILPQAPPTALMRFLAALAPVRFVTFEARPAERSDRKRWAGDIEYRPATIPPAGEPPSAHAGGDLARLKARLFAESPLAESPLAESPLAESPPGDSPPVEASPARAGAATDADGRVERAMFASVADEVDAAAAWVIGEIARGTPAGAIAIVVPEVAAYAPLIADRLARLDHPGGAPVAVRVAEGLTAELSPAGLRLRALFHALEAGLEAEATLPILPWLGHPAADDAAAAAPAPAPSEVAALVYAAGIVGGREASGDEWQRSLRARRSALAAHAAAGTAGGRLAHHASAASARTLERIDRLLPAVVALEALQARVRSKAPLPELWAACRDFVGQWLRLPPDPPHLPALLDERLAPILEHRAALELAGAPALRFLAARLRSLSLGVGGRGEPAVTVGSPAALAGLPFAAVRILGLAEGVVPGSPEKDPILPDDLRAEVERQLATVAGDVRVPRGDDRALADRQALAQIVRATERALSLSAPRQWFDKSEREVSGIMLEVEMALDLRGDVPSLADLRARLAGSALAGSAPAGAEALAVLPALSLFAAHARRAVPSSWLGAPESPLHLGRLLALESERASPERVGLADGLLGSVLPPAATPGLTADRPISPSALGMLLSCPHRFLQMRLLQRAEPPARPPTDAIDSLAFGSLLHTIAEVFFRAHGEEFCRQERSDEEWRCRMERLAEQEFERFRGHYPLRGGHVIARERARVLRTAAEIVAYEWKQGPRTFVAAEYPFGEEAGVAAGSPAASVFLNGRIDRVDRLDTGGLEVRDLKTGRAHHLREEELNANIDLQVGLYSLALAATMPGARVIAATYVYAEAPRDPERRFMGEDLRRLRLATSSWLATAQALLAAGAFVRTPEKDDCTFCRFKPYCGDDAHDVTAAKLAGTGRPELLAFRDFKHEARR
jgi:RecB family exonuclease